MIESLLSRYLPKSLLKYALCYKSCMCLLAFACCVVKVSGQVSVNDSIAVITTKCARLHLTQQIDLDTVHFTKAKDNRVNMGISGCDYYNIILKVSAASTLDNEFISIDNTSLDTLSIYRLYNNKPADLLYAGGELVAYNTARNYVWHTAALAISWEPSYYLIAMRAAQKNINVQYRIIHAQILQKIYAGYERIVFFYTGIAFMISAIILLAFFLFKRSVFLYYLGYMVCMSIWILSHYGRVFPFIYPELPFINAVIKPFTSLAASFCMLAVISKIFYESLQFHRWLLQLIKVVQQVTLLFIGFMFLLLIPGLYIAVKRALMIMWHLPIIVSLCIYLFTPLYCRRAGSIAKIFALAMSVLCVVTIMQLLANSGVINNFFIAEHGMALGSLVENSVVAFGLFYGLLQQNKSMDIQVHSLEEEQTETLKRLITVQDDERKRIAGDLHDNIGPLLAALKINFRRIVTSKESELQSILVEKTETIIDDSITEIRNVAHNLMPKSLSSQGLISTLSDYFNNLQELYQKSIIFNHQVQSIFNENLQMNIYRIVCELVLNASKHSSATVITVCLMAGEKMVSVSIFDNGQGFKLDAHKNALGLQSAESRVHYLKGTFNLKSEEGKGTMISIEIPL